MTGLLAIGLTTLDIVAHPIDALTHTERAILIDGIACVPAGTAGGAAMVAAKLGMPTKIVGAVGDDLIGAFVRLGFEQVERCIGGGAGQRIAHERRPVHERTERIVRQERVEHTLRGNRGGQR